MTLYIMHVWEVDSQTSASLCLKKQLVNAHALNANTIHEMHYIYTCTCVAILSLSCPNTHSVCPRLSVKDAIEYGLACDNTLAARSTDDSMVAAAL